jgi:hypothetical protein
MDYAIAQTSLAHTYGNVTCFIADYIKNLFPENYFSTTHISTTIAHKQFSIFQNSRKEFLKKSKPMLIIRPRIEVDDSSVFLYDTYMTTNTHNLYMDTSFTNLQPFIEDNDKGIHMKFLLNRLKISYDISIITETYMDALNQSHFLKNRLPINYPMFLQASLESYVPRELFKVMGDLIETPMYDKNDSVAPFLEYVNTHSIYPVSYKMKNSTGNDEFFRYYPVNIDTTFSGLSVEEGNKKGQIVDSCALQFNVTCEFNAAGLYYLFTRKDRVIDQFVIDMKAENSDKIIPIYTHTNLYVSEYGVGWSVFCAPMYRVDDVEVDVTDISSLLNNSILKVMTYHKEHNIPYDLFIKAQAMKNNRYMEEETEWSIDYDKCELITKNCDFRSSYRLIIHINTLYVNQLLTTVYDLDKEK